MGSDGSGHDEARGEDRPPWVRVRTTVDDTAAGLPAIRSTWQGWERHVGPRTPEPVLAPDLAA
jgi:hypothetical protein